MFKIAISTLILAVIQQAQSTSVNNCEAGKFLNTTTNTCDLCPIGSFSQGGAINSCTLAYEGTYVDSTGATMYKRCDMGYVQPLKGQSNCNVCPKGTAGLGVMSARCFTCNQGTYTNVEGSQTCSSCPAGKFVGLVSETPNCVGSCGVGATTCFDCPRGKFSFEGNSACKDCAVGTYMPNTGKSSCLVSPAGYKTYNFNTSTNKGATNIVGCGFNKYSSAGATICSVCLAGTSSLPGSSSCVPCPMGYFSSNNGESCTECPEGQSSNVGATICSAN